MNKYVLNNLGVVSTVIKNKLEGKLKFFTRFERR